MTSNEDDDGDDDAEDDREELDGDAFGDGTKISTDSRLKRIRECILSSQSKHALPPEIETNRKCPR